VNECLCMCVNHIPKVSHEMCTVMGEGGRNHTPLQRLVADRKEPRARAITTMGQGREIPGSLSQESHALALDIKDSRGRPQVEPPQPWSEGIREPGAKEPGATGQVALLGAVRLA